MDDVSSGNQTGSSSVPSASASPGMKSHSLPQIVQSTLLYPCGDHKASLQTLILYYTVYTTSRTHARTHARTHTRTHTSALNYTNVNHKTHYTVYK